MEHIILANENIVDFGKFAEKQNDRPHNRLQWLKPKVEQQFGARCSRKYLCLEFFILWSSVARLEGWNL